AVVDRNGNTIVQLRGDGAGPQSPESAVRKAYTAVSWNAPTSELAKRLEQAPQLKDIPGTLFLAGGAPVKANNAPIAGIGVAGAPSGDLDEKFAQAGVASLAK
ncbi:heme-binding protein, partial [Streptomyces sp. T-3]|nr:heme-binding protein [Streptomyces sp. T-3]